MGEGITDTVVEALLEIGDLGNHFTTGRRESVEGYPFICGGLGGHCQPFGCESGEQATGASGFADEVIADFSSAHRAVGADDFDGCGLT